MTQLTKTDEKFLEVIEPHLAGLQKFVAENIRGANTMTAAAIAEAFDSGLDAKTFINGFRLAVRTGKITGIESAQRSGYRELGSGGQSRSAADVALESITPYLENIQAFVDKHIQDSTRMTAAVIYTKFKAEKGCDLSEDEFVKAFRFALRENKIIGLESAYRFGYKRTGAVAITEDSDGDNEEEKTGHDNAEVIIDDRRRVVALDRLNWGYQVRRDSGTWATEAYFNNTELMIRSIARKLLDDELKGMNRFNLDELLERFQEAEDRITKLLVKTING
jgi:hypothetical protein